MYAGGNRLVPILEETERKEQKAEEGEVLQLKLCSNLSSLSYCSGRLAYNSTTELEYYRVYHEREEQKAEEGEVLQLKLCSNLSSLSYCSGRLAYNSTTELEYYRVYHDM